MARGLKYLHNEKKILHGDIKSSNVVIRGDFESIKICDVGVSLPLDENMIMCDPEAYYIGTESWKPKEALDDDGVITDKADMYAFGLTLWEMMTLTIPHLNLPPEDDDDEGVLSLGCSGGRSSAGSHHFSPLPAEDSFDEDDFDEDAYYEALGTRPPLNAQELDDSYQRAIELFFMCSSEDPKERPSAAQIVEVLEAENVQ
uniref:non-specific serine/threonine protein kinase n=1 Tax=Engystomops pustulosus TaxID=76066 RepID=A0AAV6YSP0_ENGPU|nr:hypothetical protein GDO81_022047 [Engystomops pustulosus]